MFYPGHEKLSTKYFSKVIFEKDFKNPFHKNAYFVKLLNDVVLDSESGDSDEEKIILGHLNRPVAKATHKILTIPDVKMLG